MTTEQMDQVDAVKTAKTCDELSEKQRMRERIHKVEIELQDARQHASEWEDQARHFEGLYNALLLSRVPKEPTP